MSQATSSTSQASPLLSQLVESIRDGSAVFMQPWSSKRAESISLRPFNPVSNAEYKAANRLILATAAEKAGFTDPRWMTKHQAENEGYEIHENAKPVQISFFQMSETKARLDENGDHVLDENGQKMFDVVKLEKPILRVVDVYNASDMDNVPALSTDELTQPGGVDLAERLLQASEAKIVPQMQGRAFFRAKNDEIGFPDKSLFEDERRYYANAVRQLGEWSGGKGRLDRPRGAFGTPDFAREQLVSSIAGWMTGQDLGIGSDCEFQKGYAADWSKLVEKNPNALFKICRDAEKASGFVLDLERNREIAINRTTEIPYSETDYEMVDFIAKAREFMPDDMNKALGEFLAKDKPGRDEIAENFNKIREGLGGIGSKPFPITLIAEADKIANRVSMENPLDAPANPDLAPNLAKENTYLYVHFHEAEEVKKLGALWAANQKQWFVPKGKDLTGFDKYLNPRDPQEVDGIPLKVGFEDKDEVKELGGRWDKACQTWYIPRDVDAKPFEKFLTDKQMNVPDESKTYSIGNNTRLFVPFTEAADVKKLGAHWDKEEKTWYIPTGIDPKAFEKYLTPPEPQKQIERTRLFVPFKEREEAKALGAKWDNGKQEWYAPAGTDLEPLAKFTQPLHQENEKRKTLEPLHEIKQKMEKLGFDFHNSMPIADGKKHMCDLTNNGMPSGKGEYVIDIKNPSLGACAYNIRDTRMDNTNILSKALTKTFAVTNAVLTDEEKAIQKANLENLNDLRASREGLYNETAKRLFPFYANLEPVSNDQMLKFGLSNESRKDVKIARLDDGKEAIVLPVKNERGDFRGYMYHVEGSELTHVASGMERAGNCCILGATDMDSLAAGKPDEIFVARTYEDAAAINVATGKPSVITLNAGNTWEITKQLRDRCPDAAITVCSENLERKGVAEHARECNALVSAPPKGLKSWKEFLKENNFDDLNERLRKNQKAPAAEKSAAKTKAVENGDKPRQLER